VYFCTWQLSAQVIEFTGFSARIEATMNYQSWHRYLTQSTAIEIISRTLAIFG
jgi:hypothetical protein